MNRIILILGLIASAQNSLAQITWHLFFLQFDEKTYHLPVSSLPIDLASRQARNIPVDSLDYPVKSSYLDLMNSADFMQVHYPLRWLNGAVVILENRKDSAQFAQFPFVLSARYIGRMRIDTTATRGMPVEMRAEPVKVPECEDMATNTNKNVFGDSFYGLTWEQNHRLEVPFLHKSGFMGQGVKIAIFDAGFKRADQLSTFKHLFDTLKQNGSMVGAWNIAEPEKSVFGEDDHGMHVLSCMAAYSPGRMVGTAPFADYYLFRTEVASGEFVAEEYHWMRAAEMADSMGIQIINSSLGYSDYDDPLMSYRYRDLNGRTSVIARAAGIAVSKGMLVVNAAGNEGNKAWKKLITPADAEEVISVAAVDVHEHVSSFSSRGPTGDGRLKPDVAALGVATAIASTYGSFFKGNGTSYASPVMCGALACLYQKHGFQKAPIYRQVLLSTGNKNQQPDTLTGHGIPSFRAADFFLQSARNTELPEIMFLPDTVQGKVQMAAKWRDMEEMEFYILKPVRFLLFFHRNKKLYHEYLINPGTGSLYREIPLTMHYHKGAAILRVVFRKNKERRKMDMPFWVI